MTTAKTTEAEQRQRTTAEVSGTGSGVTNPSENRRRNVVAFNGLNRDMRECWLTGLSGDDREKRVWLQSAAACGGMPSNGKQEKIIGTGCNHHMMMVAMEKRNPVIIFYLK